MKPPTVLPAKAMLGFARAFLPTLSFFPLRWAFSFTFRAFGWIWSMNKPDMIMSFAFATLRSFSFALRSFSCAAFKAATEFDPRFIYLFYLTRSKVVLEIRVSWKKDVERLHSYSGLLLTQALKGSYTHHTPISTVIHVVFNRLEWYGKRLM